MKLRLRTVDWVALAFLGFEAPSLAFSQYRANSVRASEVVAMAALAYFVVRLTMREPIRAAWLAALSGLGGAWLALIGILQFSSGARQLAAVGLTDLVAFRTRLIHPIREWIPGEGYTALLLTLPFACAAAAYVWRTGSQKQDKTKTVLAILALVPALPIVAALFLSLSRAVFWSTIIFLFVACGLMAAYRVVAVRQASLLLAGVLGALLLVMVCETALYPDIFKAYAGSHTSQVRSTRGRIGIWSRSLELMLGHAWWGVGSSNAALSLLSSAEQEETTGFASRAFSLPIQILAEKGLVGFVVYSAFLLLAGWEFHRGMRSRPLDAPGSNAAAARVKRGRRNRKKHEDCLQLQSENAHRAMKCCFAAGLIAVLLRELTYSSLLEHTLTMAAALALAALMCATSQPEGLAIKPVAIAIASVVLILRWPFHQINQADAMLREFYSQVASAKFSAARESIDEAIRLWPWNARYYGWRAYIASQQLPSQCLGHSANGEHNLSEQEKKSALAAANDYRQELRLNDRDAVAHHDLSWLEHVLGDDADAAQDWRASVEIDPDNAAFHLSYGMFLEENGSVEAARAQYESAIERTPSILDSPFFTRYRSRLPESADSIVKEAIGRLESRLGQGNDPIMEARLGKLYQSTGNLGRAGKLLEDAAQKLPNLPLVWFNLGELYEALGNQAKARTCYERARAIDSSLARPYLRIGELSLRAGDKDSAIHNLNQAVQRWQRINPITSAHNNRLYDGPQQTIDDLMPMTLVWYVSPCESSEAWSALSGLFPQKPEYAERTRTCEQISAPHGGIE